MKKESSKKISVIQTIAKKSADRLAEIKTRCNATIDAISLQ